MLKQLIRRAAAHSSVGRAAAWLKDRPVVVLCYHDLRERHDPASWLRVEQAMFRDHLIALARVGTFIDPFAIDVGSRTGNGPFFVLTFDDGYRNNLRLGAPVLEELRVPALHFISTHNLTTGEPFWFDRVAHAVQGAAATAIDLRDVGLERYEFAGEDDERRWSGIQRLLKAIQAMGDPGGSAVDGAIAAIESRLGRGTLHDQFRPLTADELVGLKSNVMVRIGSHGHEHVLLTRLPDDALGRNLSTSRAILEQTLGSPVEHLAYPNGLFDARVTTASERAGYTHQHTTIPRRHERGQHEVPRFLVGGYDTPEKVLATVNRILTFT